jgi:peptide/nickel transport system permease protein
MNDPRAQTSAQTSEDFGELRRAVSETSEVSQPTDAYEAASEALIVRAEEESRYGLSQWRLMWRKFIRSRTAIIGGVVVLLFYLTAAFANFLAPYGGDQRYVEFLYAPPQGLHFDPQIGLYIYGLTKKFDQETLKATYTTDTSRRIPVRFFVHDQPYKLFGLIESDVHLFGSADKNMGVFLLGADRQGRDMLSRILIGSQMSLTIGLVGVFMSLIIGSILGVASGYFGGAIDNVMQRLIEVIRSFPSIPLWMALTAALPQHWPPERVYFAITVILSLIGWTWLARQLRGKVLALREEEFVTAAQLSGAGDVWVIFRHLIPAVFSHIIVIATLAMPGMILAESALSFLNLGLRPPLISWGVLLQEAQNLETLRHFPWLLMPAAFISAAVLAFNFFGDGLRDAADPYSV